MYNEIFQTPSAYTRFPLPYSFPKSPISAAKPSSVNSSKHNGRNMVCFDEQTPKLIDGNNILTIYQIRLGWS